MLSIAARLASPTNVILRLYSATMPSTMTRLSSRIQPIWLWKL